jgi:hypothetical protein
MSRDDYIFGLTIFYAFLFLFLGFWGGGYQEEQAKVLGLNIGFDIVSGIKEMPVAINIFIFGTLSIFITWILISSLAPSGS